MTIKTILAGGSGCLLLAAGLGYCAQAAARDTSAMATRVVLMDDRDPSQGAHEVADSRTFYDGQRFRLTVRPSQAGYLYVMCRSSQGEAKLLYPNESGNNFVEESQTASLPGEGWFRFDRAPGVEHMFIILSESPIKDLDAAANEGGDLSMATLRHYAASTNEKGIEIAQNGVEVERADPSVVKQIDLRHRPRK